MNTHPILSSVRNIRRLSRPDTIRDWFIIMGGASLILIGIVAWNMWEFNTILNGGSLNAPAPSTAPSSVRPSLDSIHTLFENRAAEEAVYASSASRFTDPSQ